MMADVSEWPILEFIDVGSAEVARKLARELNVNLPPPEDGDFALFDGWNIWPFDMNDPLARLMLEITGISLYRWDGTAYVAVQPKT